jgi:type II secretory pathway component PulC
MSTRSILRLGLVVIAACGGGSAPPRAEPSRAVQPVSSAEPPLPARPGHLWRRDVVATLSRGLGHFLTRLQLEPSLAGGKFRGWRIVKLAEGDPLWKGVDLAPADVVTLVNGRPIERPEQALTAFQSLAVAPELRVTYERDGARREIAYPIDEDPTR